MKEIKAYIKPHMLSNVVTALSNLEGLTGLSVTRVQGFGRSRAKNSRHRIVEDLFDYAPHVKLEIVCSDTFVDEIVSIIEKYLCLILKQLFALTPANGMKALCENQENKKTF